MFPQMQFLPYLRLAGIAEDELRWLGRPINAAVGQKQLLVRLEQADLETAGSGVANKDFHKSFSGSTVIPLSSEDEDEPAKNQSSMSICSSGVMRCLF
jgi:hypothetical protein